MKLADIDYEQSMALVAEAEGSETGELIAMARYDLDPETRLADVALVVLDAFQNKGIGTTLFKQLVAHAKAQGVAGFTADVLVNNGRMLGIFNKSGERVETQLEGGIYRVKITFS